MSAYVAVDIETCRKLGHRFETFGSDKTPLKLNIACKTCSEQIGKTAVAAYGTDVGSFGAWRQMQREDAEPEA